MPHECVKCGKIYSEDSTAVIKGCECGARFFFYIRQDKYDKLKERTRDVRENLKPEEVKEMEEDVRALLGKEEDEEIVVLAIETIRMVKPGKYEIDVAKLFRGKPVVIKIAEGKYIIDLTSAFNARDISDEDEIL